MNLSQKKKKSLNNCTLFLTLTIKPELQGAVHIHGRKVRTPEGGRTGLLREQGNPVLSSPQATGKVSLGEGKRGSLSSPTSVSPLVTWTPL